MKFKTVELVRIVFVLWVIAWIGCAGSKEARRREMDAEVSYNTGLGHLAEGNLTQAQGYLQRALELNSRKAEYHHALGLVYLGLRQPEAARSYIAKAIELDPDNPDQHNNLATVYIQLRRPEDAIREARLALKDSMYMTPAAALYNIGKAYQLLEKRPEAVDAFTKALEKEPAFDRAVYELAQMAMEDQNYPEAIRLFRNTIDANQRHWSAYWSLALAYQADDKPDQAIRVLDALLKRVPQDSEMASKAKRLLATLRGEE